MSSHLTQAQDQQLDHSEWNHAVQILFAFLLGLVGAVHLAASFVLGPWATLLAAALAALFATLWFVVPLVHLVRHRRP